MRKAQTLYVALVITLAGVPCSAALVRDASAEQDSQSADDVVIRGRVLSETAEPIPPTSKDIVILASHYTYHLRVKSIISGKKQSSDIVATCDCDAALRKDVDLIFHLTRKPDGTYEVKKVDRAS